VEAASGLVVMVRDLVVAGLWFAAIAAVVLALLHLLVRVRD
jgi:hypothetical protein